MNINLSDNLLLITIVGCTISGLFVWIIIFIIKLLYNKFNSLNLPNKLPKDTSIDVLNEIKIKIYVSNTVPQNSDSYKIKQFLDTRRIPHISKNLDDKYQKDEIFALSNQKDKPLVLAKIGDNSQIKIIGYDEKKLKKIFKQIIKLYKQ